MYFFAAFDALFGASYWDPVASDGAKWFWN